MTRPTGAAKLPGLPVVNTGNAALDRWIQAVSERLEVREGTRGNPHERAVTLRELDNLGLTAGTRSSMSRGGVMVQQPDGSFSAVAVDAFSDSIRSTRLYKDLVKKLDDVTRFDEIPTQVRAILLNDIAAEAQKRGADIQQLEHKLQSATESLAYTVQEVTAAVEGSMAGVRNVTYANATANRATAGQITQLAAALDGTGSASIEESLVVIADRTAGLSSQYMIKLNAGNAVTGYGLMASEDPTGVTESSFIVQAAQFALTGTYTYMQGDALSTPVVTPPSAAVAGQTWYNTRTRLSYRAAGGTWAQYTPAVPFGVNMDTNTIYLNGQVKINTGGATLDTLATNAAVQAINYIGAFASAPASAPYKKNAVYRNTTDGNSYILSADAGAWGMYLEKGTAGATGTAGVAGATGAAGANGANGSAGARGSMTFYASGSAWSDVTADGAVTAITGSASKIIGDTVTISNGSSFAGTKYWSGASWVAPGVVIDGNLLVNGTVSATSLIAGTLTGFTIQTAATGARYVLTGTSFAGYDSSGSTRVNIDMATGVSQFISTGFGPAVSGTNPSGTGVQGSSQGAGAGVSGQTGTGYGVTGFSVTSGVGVQGYSASGFGAVLSGNATKASLMLPPLGALPSDRSNGSVCFYNGNICIANGTHWYTPTNMTQLT